MRDTGSAKLLRVLVDLIGIEPMTSSMPWKRAPSCATGPHRRVVLIVVYGIEFVKPGRLVHPIGNCPGDYRIVTSICLNHPARASIWLFLCWQLCFIGAFRHCPSLSQIRPRRLVPPSTASAIVQPALADVQNSVSGVNIAHWKAPNEVRSVAQQNASSILRDLGEYASGAAWPGGCSRAIPSPRISPYTAISMPFTTCCCVCMRQPSLAAPQEEADALFYSLQNLRPPERSLATRFSMLRRIARHS